MASIVPKGCTIRRVRLVAGGAMVEYACPSKGSFDKLVRGVRSVTIGDASVTGNGSRVGFDFGATCSRTRSNDLSCKAK